MNCSRARRLYITEGSVVYGTRDLSPLARHLLGCVHCREAAERYDRDRRLIRAAFEDLPLRPRFTEEVMERIRKTE